MTTQHYGLLIEQARGLLSTESDPAANAANLSSLLYFNLEKVNWVGFYFLKGEELVLGPFHGQPACTRIPVGQGVCGQSFARMQTLLVKNVHEFSGHIACDSNSESEIVVPFMRSDIAGVLDIDSPVLARFGNAEEDLFEAVVELYLESTQC